MGHQKEYRNFAWAHSDEIRGLKIHLELKLVMEMKSNKKDFYLHVSSKRKTKENLCPLLNEITDLVAKDMEQGQCLPLLSL